MPVLFFLWKWKIASTSAIALRYFGDFKSCGVNTYKRLRRLKRRGYISNVADNDTGMRLWTLTRKGFAVVKNHLPRLKEDGCESECVSHDLLVMAVHLGDCLLFDPDQVARFTEQELRRYDFEFYPKWVPKSTLHRPDGYWKISTGAQSRIIALEVEITRKTHADYRCAADFYGQFPGINSVVWVVPSTGSLVEKITEAFHRTHPELVTSQQFFHVDDVRKRGWDAQCVAGEYRGRKLSDILGKPSWHNRGITTADSRPISAVGAILDMRIFGQSSRAYSLIAEANSSLPSTPSHHVTT